MTLKQLVGNAKNFEWTNDMGAVLGSVDHIQQHYFDALEDNRGDDLLSYNEMASASVLASAATRLNMHALSEYLTTKRDRTDMRRNADVRSRSDLWIRHGDIHYGIELKQNFSFRNLDHLRFRLLAAQADARCLPRSDFHVRLGCLIVSTWYLEEEQFECAEPILTDFVNDDVVDAAWSIVYDGPRPTYFYFSEVK